MKKNKNIYKKTLTVFFMVLFCFYFTINTVKAADSTIVIERVNSQQNGQTGKWAWVFNIKTTNIPDNTDVLINIYKNDVLYTEQTKEKIINNEVNYYTDAVLDSDSTYKIIFTIENPKLSAEYSAKAGDSAQGEVVYLDPLKDSKNNSKVYTLLAPIGKLTVAPTNLGDYFNIIFKLIIGLCGALAVVMIVVGGVQYMGDESIFGKTEAKSHITSAILGLLIALGAYALLNTVNPALLGKGGINIAQVSAEITPLYDRGATDQKQPNGESVRCVPLLSGPCSVANLTTSLGVDVATATAMSKICNMESGGTSVQSGTDVCKPSNTAFSFGLFQVNLASNGILAGADCANLFDRKVSSVDAIAPKYTSGFTCNLLSGKETLYNTCKNRLLDTATNLSIAKSLLAASPSKNPWVGDKKYCASAFN